MEVSKTERFECQICSESEPNEPVVTLCGHIYCWPCIHQWLHEPQSGHQTPLLGQEKKKNCLACKSEISGDFLVPLYGRNPAKPTRSTPVNAVPRRPSPPKLDLSSCNYLAMKDFHRTVDHHDLRIETTPFYRTGMFGNADSVFLFPSYPDAGYRSPRLRRIEIHAERSLNRVSFFLFCCYIMCLLFF